MSTRQIVDTYVRHVNVREQNFIMCVPADALAFHDSRRRWEHQRVRVFTRKISKNVNDHK